MRGLIASFFLWEAWSVCLWLSVKAAGTASSGQEGSTVMNMCIIMESNSTLVAVDYNRLAAAIDLALVYIEEEVLGDTGITVTKIYRDGGPSCAATQIAATTAMKLFSDGFNCDVYLGPGCSDSAADICNIASYKKTPVFAIPASGLTGPSAPRSLFPHLIRMSYKMRNVGIVITETLKLLSFTHSFCIVDETVVFDVSAGDSLFERYRVEPAMLRASKFVYIGENVTDEVCRDHLKTAEESARAIILLTHGSTTRRIMLLAKDAGMTDGDYVYIAVELFESRSWGYLTPKGNDGRDADAQSAFDSLLVVSLENNHGTYLDTFRDSYSDIAVARYNYSFAADTNVTSIVTPLVTAYFDAVVVYGNALKAVQSAGESLRNSDAILAFIRKTTFTSPLTQEIIFDETGDRLITYVVSEILPNGQYNVAMQLNTSTGVLAYTGNITWRGGVAPVDEPFCGYTGHDPKCSKKSSTGIIVGVSLALLALCVAAAAGRSYVKRRNARDPNWWKVSLEELDFRTDSPNQTERRGSTEPEKQDTATLSEASGDQQTSRHIGKAELRGAHLAVIQLPYLQRRPTAALVTELENVRLIHHVNLVRFVGLCLDEQDVCLYLLEEDCEKGTLVQLMASDSVNLDDVFKNSFIKDIVEGMTYLHGSVIRSHGFLSSQCCVVNSKFMVKIDDYGITQFRDDVDFLPPKASDTADKEYRTYLWRSPELLREVMPATGTQKGRTHEVVGDCHRRYGLRYIDHLFRYIGDVYSFGIVMQEIITQSGPFLFPLNLLQIENTAVKNLVMEVKRGMIPPCRPKVLATACPVFLHELMQNCWEEEPEDRPTFAHLRSVISKSKTGGKSIVDHLLEKMEEYSHELEDEVARKTEEFKAEKARSDNLLKNMLPRATAEALTRGETVPPESFASVTIFFSDIVGFAELCSRISPLAVLETLNSLYEWSDTIMDGYDVYKVEAIADIFMVASGLPIRNDGRHAAIMGSLALHLRRDVTLIKVPNHSSADLRIRVGMHSGPCVAGIVGLKMPRYCLFGDSVNTASRMQSHGEADKIHLTESAAQLLREAGGFIVTERGEMVIKGKGLMTTYWLEGLRDGRAG